MGVLRALLAVLVSSCVVPAVAAERHAMTSGFGWRAAETSPRPEFHPGIDLAAPAGAPVWAMAPGVVAFAGRRGGYGLEVEVDHGGGWLTRYGHLSMVLCRPGARVDGRTVIGLVGASGRSTGPHLHLELRFAGLPVDPHRLFPWLPGGGPGYGKSPYPG